MTTQTEVAYPFDDLRTVGDVDRRYKELFAKLFPDPFASSDTPEYWALGEAYRKAHERLVFERDHHATRSSPDRISPRLIRNWALLAGIPLGKGKIPYNIENAYRREKSMPLLENDPEIKKAEVAERKAERQAAKVARAAYKEASRSLRESVSPSDVRAWAHENGIECGDRGRVHISVIEQYVAAMAS